MIMAVMGEIHSMHLRKEKESYTEEIVWKRIEFGDLGTGGRITLNG